MPEFRRGAKKQDVPLGGGVVSLIEGKSVAIFNRGGSFYAIGNICPHRGGPLGEGELKGTVVTCPWHAWEFDIVTGCNPENPKLKVPRYEVRIQEDEILVKVD
jgi:nitrite reductase (NADH) small subunit